MPRPPLLLVCLLAAPALPASAQPRVGLSDLTPLDRQKDDFYGAVADGGRRVTATWSLTPASVTVGGDMTLTLTVGNAANPHELTRPSLAARDDFRQLFQVIEDLPTQTSNPAAFRYKVRPRTTGQFQIPELKYLYYAAQAPPDRRFQTAYATPLPFTVTEPVVKASPAVPLDGPPRFFELRANSAFARSGGPGVGWYAAVFGLVAAAAVGWVAGWRALFPDAVRLARIRRNRAVRVALDRLRKAATATDPTAATATAFRGYLVARFGVPPSAQTPGEVGDGLRQLGFAADRTEEAEGLLRRCDVARFAGASDTAVSPRTAADLIERWEGVR